MTAKKPKCIHGNGRRRTVRELGRNAAVTYEPAPRRT